MRFHRNHRLMLEVFNDSSIPDTRHVVTKSRLLILKKQVQSLQIHQVGVAGGVVMLREALYDREERIHFTPETKPPL